MSIFRRYCNFTRRAGTNRHTVPHGVFEECKLTFLIDFRKAITRHKFPPELVLNADQTPSLYVIVGKMTSKNSSSVPIKGLTNKRKITLTFLFHCRSSRQYSSYTNGKLPEISQWASSFQMVLQVSQNEKHYSNKAETLSLIDSHQAIR